MYKQRDDHVGLLLQQQTLQGRYLLQGVQQP
jgi:hypothetical protein